MGRRRISTALPILFVPVGFMNAFGGIAGFIWLATRRLVVGGIVSLLLSSLSLGVALMPGGLIGMPRVALFERRFFLTGGLLVMLGEAWTFAVMFVWCYIVSSTPQSEP
jgi:hypothetical protein